MASVKEPLALPLTGRLITGIDGTQIGLDNFQVLKNMRYSKFGIKSISGMTKINTTATPEVAIANVFHYKKTNESHLLVEANGKLYKNDTTIPNAGNFTVAPIFTDSSGAGNSRFTLTSDAALVYCNGIDTVIWNGDEAKVGQFLIGETINYDYTTQINNDINSDAESAVMHTETVQNIDNDTLLLLHMDGASGSTTFTDSSPVTPHTVTANGTAAISTVTGRFSQSGLFDGAGYLSIPDNADFNLAAVSWSIDWWMYPNLLATEQCIYSQQTDANNYFKIILNTSNQIELIIVAAAVTVIDAVSDIAITTGNWYHIEISLTAGAYRIYINGIEVEELVDADVAADYTGSVYIGSFNGGSNNFTGYLDEFRLSDVARHTTSFDVSLVPYSNNSFCFLKIGTVRPIQQLKMYVRTANGTAATSSGYYWNGSILTPLTTYVDNTSVGGKTLAQTGTITFADTQNTAKPTMLNGAYAFWYLFIFDSVDAATRIYEATVQTNFVNITDIWDGVPVNIIGYLFYTTQLNDYLSRVAVEDWVSGSSQTFVALNGMTTAYYQLVGTLSQSTGLHFTLPAANANDCAIIVQYYNGSSFQTLQTVIDDTRTGNASFSKSGWVTWEVPDDEQPYEPSKGLIGYYYKISFSAQLSGTVSLDFVQALPAAQEIERFNFGVTWQNRLLLFEQNHILMGAVNSSSVFNGSDSMDLYVGDNQDIIAAASLYSRYGNATYDNLVICKKTGTWLLDGINTENYYVYTISSEIGCTAPLSMVSCSIGVEYAPGIKKHMVIWQTSQGIVGFDGNSLIVLSTDIEDLFNQNSSNHINLTYSSLSTAFFDTATSEYHWLFVDNTSTSINREFVFDLALRKWYEINRTNGKKLVCGVTVTDTNGNAYSYGCLPTGYVERLEYGTTFDGTAITSTFRTGDIALNGWGAISNNRFLKLISKANATDTATVSVTYFGDCVTTGTALDTMSITSSTKRVVQPKQSINIGDSVFHSFQFSISTTLENIGFEPLGINLFKTYVREDT